MKVTRRKISVATLNNHFFDNNSPQLDSFGRVLVLTLILVLLLLFVNIDINSVKFGVEPALVSIFTALTLIYALRASGVSKRYQRIALLLIGIALAATLVLISITVFGGDKINAPQVYALSPIWVLIAIVTPIATTHRLLMHREVKINTMFAAIASYLQIAVAFALTFMLLDTFMNGHFFQQAHQSTVYMYYSLVTITTVGYGDFTAANDTARAASVMESLIGQIYLVVVVAMLVGLFVVYREQRRSLEQSRSTNKSN